MKHVILQYYPCDSFLICNIQKIYRRLFIWFDTINCEKIDNCLKSTCFKMCEIKRFLAFLFNLLLPSSIYNFFCTLATYQVTKQEAEKIVLWILLVRLYCSAALSYLWYIKRNSEEFFKRTSWAPRIHNFNFILLPPLKNI